MWETEGPVLRWLVYAQKTLPIAPLFVAHRFEKRCPWFLKSLPIILENFGQRFSSLSAIGQVIACADLLRLSLRQGGFCDSQLVFGRVEDIILYDILFA